MSNRFDLEQQILDCWKITDDIPMMEAQGANVADMTSLACVYEYKFKKLWEIFETMCHEQQFKNSDDKKSVPDISSETVVPEEAYMRQRANSILTSLLGKDNIEGWWNSKNAAFEMLTGEEMWEKDRDKVYSYLLAQIGGGW